MALSTRFPTVTPTARTFALLATIGLIWGVLVPTIDVAGAQEDCTIVGTAADDILVGTDGDDVICGGDGDDILIGGFGSDTIRGEGGHDRLAGGIGNDRLYGGEGDDQLTGGGGHDVIDGGDGDDQLVGGYTNDNLRGGAGADTCDDDGSDQLIDCESAFTGDAVRIMTLGDSITEGGFPSGKYRTSLAEHLDDIGCRYDYVGSVLDQQLRWGDSYDPDHEGHGGWTADDLLTEAPGWFATNTPDIVILHAGTNDSYRSHTTESTVTDIEAIIAAARANNPAVTLLVARIIPGDFIEDRVLDLNAALDVAIPPLDQPTSRVVLVDQHTGFDLDLHTHDRIHPDDGGARIMGDRFWTALEPLLGSSCFTDRTSPPVTTTIAPPPTTTTTIAPPSTTIMTTPTTTAAAPPPTTNTVPTATTTAPPVTTTTTAPPPATTTTTTAPVPQPAVNLIENPSVETTTNPWAQDRWGDLNATFTWLDEGAEGTKSLRVRVTSHTWGDAKWVSNKAPTIAETTYSYTESYRATTPTNLVAHHTKTDGTSTYTWVGWLPAAPTWTTHTLPVTTPPNTTHTRIFHVIGAIGTLDIDNAILQLESSTAPPIPTTTTTAPATTTTTTPPTTTTTAPATPAATTTTTAPPTTTTTTMPPMTTTERPRKKPKGRPFRP